MIWYHEQIINVWLLFTATFVIQLCSFIHNMEHHYGFRNLREKNICARNCSSTEYLLLQGYIVLYLCWFVRSSSLKCGIYGTREHAYMSY